MKKKKISPVALVVGVLAIGGLGTAGILIARADNSVSPVFSYDSVAQVLTVTASDNASFDFITGVDQFGSGFHGFVGATSWSADPASFGDSVGSEWLVTNNDAASTQVCNAPTYTGDPQADFKTCTDAITANGGTYELGSFGTIPPPPGGDPAVTIGDQKTAEAGALNLEDASATASTAVPPPGAKGKIGRNGFTAFKGSVFVYNPSSAVTKTDGRIFQTMLSKGIIRLRKGTTNTYVFRQDYTFASPSQPAALVIGRLVNGWKMWATADGTLLGKVYHIR